MHRRLIQCYILDSEFQIVMFIQHIFQFDQSVWFRAHCTNVVHDLGSVEPRSKVEPSSR